MASNKLKHKLDAVFSKYVRLRDSNSDGIGRCITCGRLGHWKRMDCGHFMKRQHLATRYDEQNCNIQCKRCNAFEQGANEKYHKTVDQKWGEGTARKLETKCKNRAHWPCFYFEQLIKEYEQKVKEMENG